MSIATYCIKNKSNLWTECSPRLIFLFSSSPLLCNISTSRRGRKKILLFLHQTRCHPVFFFVCFFYSERDVVHHCSGLSPCIPQCHIQPIFTGDWPWRVQSSTASEHVASWWRGGGCGIGEKGNVQKHRLARLLVPTCCDIPVMLLETLKQVVKPPPTKRANLLWNVFVYF